jgi:hypothetical protein
MENCNIVEELVITLPMINEYKEVKTKKLGWFYYFS